MLAVPQKYRPQDPKVVARQRSIGITWKRRVRCVHCGELRTRETAHWHQGQWICDEVCWDDRLYSSE